MYGASGDAHVRSEVSGACCGLRFVLEALWRICRVYIYLHLRAELLQLAGVVTRDVAVRGQVLGRVSPGRVGRISLAVVALGREMVTCLPFSGVAARHVHPVGMRPRQACLTMPTGRQIRAVVRVQGARGRILPS